MADTNDRNEGASPPCSMDEAPPDYMGYLTDAELAAALNELLEGERAGARVLGRWLRDESWSEEARAIVRQGRDDEARYCALLDDIVKRLGGTPSRTVGVFLEKAMKRETHADRLAFLNRGQAAVARRLGELLPRIADDRIHGELMEMRDTHERNIAAVEALLGDL